MKRKCEYTDKISFLIVAAFRLYLSFLLDDRGSDEYIESDCCWKTHTREIS